MISNINIRHLMWSCGLVLLMPTLVMGQELTFESSVDQSRISVDQMITFIVSVSGEDLDDVPEPDLPDMPDFAVVARTSSSSSNISIINGKMSSSRTIQYIYRLQPRKTGTFMIDAASINHSGRRYRTTPIRIEVVDIVSGQTPASPSPGGSGSSGRSSATGQVKIGEDLSIQAIVDKKEVYIGEQMTVTYKLYVRDRVGLSNVQYDRIPPYTGFWMEELFAAQHLDFKPEIVNGKRYNVATIKRVALFPTGVGDQEIEALSILCDIPAPRRRSLLDNFFDDPLDSSFDSFFGRAQRVTIHTEPQPIKVKPLPAEGKPKNFSGGVGQFTIHGLIDNTQTEVSQPLTLTVVLQGTGNLKTINDPVLPDLESFKQYTSSSSDAISKLNTRVGGEKTYTYVLIPLKPDIHRIDPITFAYFDPSAQLYKTISTDPIDITVEKGNVNAADLAYVSPKAEVKQLRQDIQYIKPATVALIQQGAMLYKSPWYLLFQLIPIAAIIFAVLYKSHISRLQQDVGYARWRKAFSESRREGQMAESTLKQGELEQSFTHISNMLHQYIGDKCNVPNAGLTSQQMADLLKTRGVDADTLQSLIDCLDACDMARFAPTSVTRERTQEVLDSANQVLARLEKKLEKTTA